MCGGIALPDPLHIMVQRDSKNNWPTIIPETYVASGCNVKW